MTLAPPASGVLDAAGLVAELRATFNTGRTRPLAWRRRQLEGLRRLLSEAEPELLAALATDLGKPAVEGWLADLAISIDEIDVYLHNLEAWAAPEKVKLPLAQKPGKAYVRREPLGVVLVIAPWNYPVQLLLLPVAAALAAGNAVVAKPSELAPATSAAIARLVPRYLDADAVRVVQGGVSETTALLEQRWDHIFYTGNGTVGRVVMAAAAKHLTPVTLELGGKSPTIVDRSADISVATRRIAWGKYLNAGQTCVAPDHVFVHEAVHDQFLDALHSAVTSFYGADPHASVDYARIVNDRHFGRLTGLLDAGGFDSVAIGGDRDASDRYLSPTVVTGVHDDAAVMGEEIFGPILPVIKVPDLDAAIDRINAGDKPLALYAFGSGTATDRIIGATSSGGVCVNHTVFHLAVPGLPFGGVGESGMGSYHGRWGFDTFSHRRAVLEKPTALDPSIAYPPYGRVKKAILRRMFG
ncbi:MAG: aldehyde dehydrogenase family protein [Acidimicrobiales bacterium]